MTATFIDGVRVSEEVKGEVAVDVAEMKSQGVQPGLAVVLVGDDSASSSYVSLKAKTCQQLGIHSRRLNLPRETRTERLLEEIDVLNRDDDIDGILVQLPLPAEIDRHAVLEHVDPVKDVDGFHSANMGALLLGCPALVACTPLGIMELLRRSAVMIEGARAVVLGRSDDVGKPQSVLLLHENATVTICHSRTRGLAEVARSADILIVSVGKTAMVTAEFVKPGAVVVDVGTNKVSNREEIERLFGPRSDRLKNFEKLGYVWVGDVDERSTKEVASKLTPVPGGVGPMTIAMLMKNTLKAARMRRTSGC